MGLALKSKQSKRRNKGKYCKAWETLFLVLIILADGLIKEVYDMNRRQFIKTGLLSIASIYLYPETLLQYKEAGTLFELTSDKQQPVLVGKHHGEIINGRIMLSERFGPSLSGKQVHILADNCGYVKLILGDKSLKEEIEREIYEFTSIKPEVRISYLGTSRLGKNGYFSIPLEARDLAGIRSTGDVIIVGIINSIEIWDRKKWEDMVDISNEENRKLCEEFKKVLDQYGL